MRPWQVLLLFFIAVVAFIVARQRANNRQRATGTPGLSRRVWVTIAVVGMFAFVILASTATTGTPSATSTPRAARTDADYAMVDVRDLKKNPDAYKDKSIQVQGEVFNIKEQNGQTFLQMWVAIPGGSQFDREAVVVTYGGALPNVYEKTKITVFGIGAGTDSGKNAFGGTNTQPAIRADRVSG